MKKKINTIADFLEYVSQLNYVKVDGDRFIADNGAVLSLQYKLENSFGLSGIQLIPRLMATADGGLVQMWGSQSDAENLVISNWWKKNEYAIINAEYKAQDNAVEELRKKLG